MKIASTQKETVHGVIHFDTIRNSDEDINLMAMTTTGRLISPDGEAIGMCQFFVYRRKRNRSSMDADYILQELDALSDSATQMGHAISEADEFTFEYHFNRTCLLIADRIQIEPAYRGSGIWKMLFFSTMEEALKPLKSTPAEFYLKAFPLQFEGAVTEENSADFKKAEQRLKEFYSQHLDAQSLGLSDDNGCFMRASVPDHLQR